MIKQTFTAKRERGVVLMLALIVLVAMGLATVALMRTVDASTAASGNLAFKDWAAHAAERGVNRAVSDFDPTGAAALAAPNAVDADLTKANYSSVMLPVNAQGIPNVLLNTTTFDATYSDAATRITYPRGERVRYVVERLCAQAGPASETACLTISASERGGSQPTLKTGAEFTPLYRITVRVDGARDTLHFSQVTFRPA
jgi:type IV pilus assembly protein PilX